MVRRNLLQGLLPALQDTPVVLLHGARQTGKSTLVKAMAAEMQGARYLSLDMASVLSQAIADPHGFVQSLRGPAVLDEVQRAPELFRAIKVAVDEERRPGRFLLTGSADVMLLPGLSESLAGRMEIQTLWPFSQDELANRQFSLVDALFSGADLTPAGDAPTREQLLSWILRGGFPEAIQREDPLRRSAWFDNYVATILQRDIRDIAEVEQLVALPKLLQFLATRSMTLLNLAEVSRSLQLPYTTLRRYVSLLEMTFLLQFLPPYFSNLGKRLVKAPKPMLCDTGLMAHLLGVRTSEEVPDYVVGPLVENYAVMEIRKQLSWSRTRASMYHFRDQAGREVDLILEGPLGRVAGVEVKASSQVGANDFKHLHFLREALGVKFVQGIVLYLGSEWFRADESLQVVPLGALGGIES